MDLVNRERGRQGKFKAENASGKGLGGDEEDGRDSVAEAPWAPVCPGQWASRARLAQDRNWARTMEDGHPPRPSRPATAAPAAEPLPCGRAAGLHGQRKPGSSSCRRHRCCRSVPFRTIPWSSEPQQFSSSGFPKTGGKFCVRSGEGRLTGTCNPSLAETADCF